MLYHSPVHNTIDVRSARSCSACYRCVLGIRQYTLARHPLTWLETLSKDRSSQHIHVFLFPFVSSDDSFRNSVHSLPSTTVLALDHLQRSSLMSRLHYSRTRRYTLLPLLQPDTIVLIVRPGFPLFKPSEAVIRRRVRWRVRFCSARRFSLFPRPILEKSQPTRYLDAVFAAVYREQCGGEEGAGGRRNRLGATGP